MEEKKDKDVGDEPKTEDTADETTETQAESADSTQEDELNIYSSQFNALRALYADDFSVTSHSSKIMFQNLAAFETAFKKHGLWGLSQTKGAEQPSGSKSKIVVAEDINVRRFRPEQMPIPSTVRSHHIRNLLEQMKNAEGPMALLYKMVSEKQRVRVDIRRLKGVRGRIEGTLLYFDKHWNLLLVDVIETFKRRKYKYTDNKVVGTPSDCTEELKKLGISLPKERVQSINRKNVEIERNLGQLYVRGDEVVLVTPTEHKGKDQGETNMSSTLMSCVRENSPPLDHDADTSGPFSLPESTHHTNMTSYGTASFDAGAGGLQEGDHGNREVKAANPEQQKRRRFHPLRNLRRIFRRRTITSPAETSTSTLPSANSTSEKNLRSATLSSISSVVSASSPSSPLTHQQLQEAYSSKSLPKSKSYSTGGSGKPLRDVLIESTANKLQKLQQRKEPKEAKIIDSDMSMATTTSTYHSHHQRQSMGVAVLPNAMNRNFFTERQKLRSVGDSSQELEDSSGHESGSNIGAVTLGTSDEGRTNGSASGGEMTDSQRSLSEGRLVDSGYSRDPLSQSHDSVFSESATASSLSIVLKAELADVLRKRRNRPDASDEDLGLPRSPASPQRRAEFQANSARTNRGHYNSNSATTENQSEVSSLSLLSVNSTDGGVAGGGGGGEHLATSTANNSITSTSFESTSTSIMNTSRYSRTSMLSTSSMPADILRHSMNSSFNSSVDEGDSIRGERQRLSHAAAKHKMAVRPTKKNAPSRLSKNRRTLETSIPEANEENNKASSKQSLTFNDTKSKTRTLPPSINANTNTSDQHAQDKKSTAKASSVATANDKIAFKTSHQQQQITSNTDFRTSNNQTKETATSSNKTKETVATNVVETTESGFLRRLMQRNSKRSYTKSNSAGAPVGTGGDDEIDVNKTEPKIATSTKTASATSTTSNVLAAEKSKSSITYNQRLEETRKEIKREIFSDEYSGFSTLLKKEDIPQEQSIKPKSGPAARQRYLPMDITITTPLEDKSPPISPTKLSSSHSASNLLVRHPSKEILQSTAMVREITSSHTTTKQTTTTSTSSSTSKLEHHFDKKPKIVGLSAFQQKISRSNDSFARNSSRTTSNNSLEASNEALFIDFEQKQRKSVEKSRSFRTYAEERETTTNMHNNMPSLPDLTINLRVAGGGVSGSNYLTPKEHLYMPPSPSKENDKCASLGFEINDNNLVNSTQRAESASSLTTRQTSHAKKIVLTTTSGGNIKNSSNKLLAPSAVMSNLSPTNSCNKNISEIEQNIDLIVKSPLISVLRKSTSIEDEGEKLASKQRGKDRAYSQLNIGEKNVLKSNEEMNRKDTENSPSSEKNFFTTMETANSPYGEKSFFKTTELDKFLLRSSENQEANYLKTKATEYSPSGEKSFFKTKEIEYSQTGEKSFFKNRAAESSPTHEKSFFKTKEVEYSQTGERSFFKNSAAENSPTREKSFFKNRAAENSPTDEKSYIRAKEMRNSSNDERNSLKSMNSPEKRVSNDFKSRGTEKSPSGEEKNIFKTEANEEISKTEQVALKIKGNENSPCGEKNIFKTNETVETQFLKSQENQSKESKLFKYIETVSSPLGDKTLKSQNIDDKQQTMKSKYAEKEASTEKLNRNSVEVMSTTIPENKKNERPKDLKLLTQSRSPEQKLTPLKHISVRQVELKSNEEPKLSPTKTMLLSLERNKRSSFNGDATAIATELKSSPPGTAVAMRHTNNNNNNNETKQSKENERKSVPATTETASITKSFKETRRTSSVTETTDAGATNTAVPEFMKIQLNRVGPTRAPKGNIVLSKNCKDAGLTVTPVTELNEKATRRLSNEMLDEREQLKTVLDTAPETVKMQTNLAESKQANEILSFKPAITRISITSSPAPYTAPPNIKETDEVTLRTKPCNKSGNTLSLQERKRLFMSNEKVKAEKKIEEIRNERRKSINEDVQRKSITTMPESITSSILPVKVTPIKLKPEVAPASPTTITATESPALESVVVLRKKSFGTAQPSNGNNSTLAQNSETNNTTTTNKKNDATPELMKVFARRSLKVKDEDINTLSDKLLSSPNLPPTNIITTTAAIVSPKKTVPTTQSQPQNVDSDKENHSASEEKLDKFVKSEVNDELPAVSATKASTTKVATSSTSCIISSNLNNRITLADFRNTGIKHSNLPVAQNVSNINQNHNNNNNNTTTSAAINSKTTFTSLRGNGSTNNKTNTGPYESLNNINALNNNYHSSSTKQPSSVRHQSLNIKSMESTTAAVGTNKNIERSATVGEFKGILQRRAEWEQRAKEALK